MNRKSLFPALAAALAFAATPAHAAAAPVDFGDDEGVFANDDECDDPRFTGEGSSDIAPMRALVGHDATDCKTAYEAGTIRLATAEELLAAEAATGSRDLPVGDFGDDSSTWANDGECDDPRFRGTGMASTLSDDDNGRDATDCSTLLEAGKIRWFDAEEEARLQAVPGPGGFFFGSDGSSLANNGICDDMRFIGEGTHPIQLGEDIRADASDCRAGFEAGTVRHRVLETGPFTARPDVARIDFGDDSSDYAKNDKCDDARFAGAGMNPPLLQDDIGRDATDCRALFEAGRVELH
ncbi:hypothetical protein [Sphingomicrobium aestuariivivum]|uniref:hypothetical protein n=1 Tax=Sphingomicrobium aestuariivivum TaxID=1582356 RepID=UPI001FD70E82|nr:hypothetical protein [Sphingomicrobium aestuariivivum]MCJ8189872.1 hypothetical protein [Sphingomicrobium aestuariivivum]